MRICAVGSTSRPPAANPPFPPPPPKRTTSSHRLLNSIVFILGYNLICNVCNVSNPILCNLLYINRLQIGTLLAPDRMRRPAGCAG
jgi:hypothetical protein